MAEAELPPPSYGRPQVGYQAGQACAQNNSAEDAIGRCPKGTDDLRGLGEGLGQVTRQPGGLG